MNRLDTLVWNTFRGCAGPVMPPIGFQVLPSQAETSKSDSRSVQQSVRLNTMTVPMPGIRIRGELVTDGCDHSAVHGPAARSFTLVRFPVVNGPSMAPVGPCLPTPGDADDSCGR